MKRLAHNESVCVCLQRREDVYCITHVHARKTTKRDLLANDDNNNNNNNNNVAKRLADLHLSVCKYGRMATQQECKID